MMRVTAVSHAKFPKVNLHGYITKNERKARDIYRGKRGFWTPKVSEPITMLRLICTLIVYLKEGHYITFVIFRDELRKWQDFAQCCKYRANLRLTFFFWGGEII